MKSGFKMGYNDFVDNIIFVVNYYFMQLLYSLFYCNSYIKIYKNSTKPTFLSIILLLSPILVGLFKIVFIPQRSQGVSAYSEVYVWTFEKLESSHPKISYNPVVDVFNDILQTTSFADLLSIQLTTWNRIL